MIQVAFRTYDVEANDFPITVTASTDADQLPDLGPAAFRIKNVSTGEVTTHTEPFHDNGDKTATLLISAASANSDIRLAVVVRFPASNPVDKPLTLTFVSNDNQKAKDKIPPDDVPIVIGNYLMLVR